MLEEQKVTNKELLTLEERRAFMKLPMGERRRRLAEQAEEAAKYFEEDYADWKELQSGDIIKY
ncbi:MAG: hypothetical protein L0387_27465 [Acidobacteria bacterium]|nr:hypothetical protein [Acidobacteriota bacterium]MCI0625340.1 hypothetical protein [Acidobacteriota bacterium]MCI0721045.1 hypothetical protein [Acidobacteriota bacterium]